MGKINIAILGAGIFVKEQHLPAVLQSKNAELKVVYSRSIKSVNELLDDSEVGEGVERYSEDTGKSLESLLERKDIDAVIVALPIRVQPSVIKKALDAGKHVLSEKPIAADIATAEELIAYSKKVTSGAKWAVAENFRYIDPFEKALIYREKLGKLTNFHLRMAGFVKAGDKYYETEWRKVPDYQGGFLLDGGVHFAAGLRKLLGPANPIVKVAAFSKLNFDYLLPVDTLNGIAITKDGTSGTVAMTFAGSKGGYDNTLQFEKGYIEATPGKLEVKFTDPKQEVSLKYDGSGVHEEVDAFVEGLLKGKLDGAQSPEEALADLALIEKMLTSAEKGGVPQEL